MSPRYYGTEEREGGVGTRWLSHGKLKLGGAM